MRKLFTFILLATLALAMNAQCFMRVNKIDGSVVEFPISVIDSIEFFEKATITPPVIDPENPVENGHEYVDLGLPSGTLWATMNLGAVSLTDCGDTFAWGETTTKDNYSLDNYRFYTSKIVKDEYGFESTIESYTKYCTQANYGPVDNLVQLDLEDDAAQVNWGGAWCMPTESACNELISKCLWSWVTLDGVSGYKVVGPSGKHIFLPAYKTDFDNNGHYWSASLYTESPSEASSLFIAGDHKDVNSGSRYSGKFVRPVISTSSLGEDQPMIANPGAGQITIAVRVPENTTNGVVLIGDMNGWNYDQALSEHRMTLVEGTNSWYSITVDYDASQGFKMLPILKKADGTEYITWSVEWTGCSVYGNNDFSKDNNLQMSDWEEGAVAYYEINAWLADPSIVFAPAGSYKFIFTPTVGSILPAGDVIFTGTFDTESWGDSQRIMTREANSYVWEGTIPEFFSCRVFIRAEAGNIIWPIEDNFIVSTDVVRDGVVELPSFTFAEEP